MEENINTVGVTINEGENFSSGIGYIALPSDIDRSIYLLDCFQNFRVSIHTAHDGFINRVQVSPDDLNWLEFPTDYTKMGTAVYYIKDPIGGGAYVIKRYNSLRELGNTKENEFKLGRVFKDSVVDISGNPEKGYLNISVNGSGKSELNINILNKNDKGVLNLGVKGSANVVASQDVNISANGQYYSKVFDPENVETVTEVIQVNNSIKIKTPNFSINNGNENFILGQKFKSLFTEVFSKLSTFVTEVSSATVTTMLGVQPLLNAQTISAYSDQFAGYKEKLDDLLSEVGFIDK